MLDNWDREFPDCPPVGYLLRNAIPSRWVRFHSLPGSKRYPEDETDFQILLERHNTILGELVGLSPRVVLVTTGYSETPEPVRTYAELDALDPDGKPWRTISMHTVWPDSGDTPTYWQLFVSESEWHPKLFDPLIRLVADDTVANVLIVEPECRWVLHPYDGGMDVIAESPAQRARLRSAYKAWLSARRDGL
jgi:hypothetical protein